LLSARQANICAPHRDGQAASRVPGRYICTVPCGHDVMVDMPDRLVEILLEVA
jgi:hypothetical protein